jgi:hypothetical protein
MAKTYNTLSTVTAGSVLTATAYNEAVENSNNYRVPPMCKVRRDATQSIAGNTQRLINWDAETFDTDSMFTASDVEITVNTAGIYLITATVRFPLNTTSTRGAAIVKNAVTSGSGDSTNVTSGLRIGTAYIDRSPDTQTAVCVSAIESFSATDTITVIAYQNSGGALDTGGQTTTEPTTCGVVWLGQVS